MGDRWLLESMGDREQQQQQHDNDHLQQRVILEWLVSSPKWRALAALGLGQVLSLLLTATGFTSSFLAREGVNAPTAQAFFNYALLAIVCGSIVLIKRPKIKVPWYGFLLLAIVDVEGNYLLVKANQYTSITSVMLLDCWSTPCVLLLTWLFLKTRYRLGHFFGVGICVTGLVLVVLSDVHAKDRSGGSNVVLGDIIVIGASMLYAIGNVTQEFIVKKTSPVELLAFLGLFGSLINGIQVLALELHELRHIQWTANAIGPFVGFALAQFSFYILAPILLQGSGSAMFTLSLLTSDMWAVAIRALAYHEDVDWLYFVAFGTVAIGLSLYSCFGEPRPEKEAEDTGLDEPMLEEILAEDPVTEDCETNSGSKNTNKEEKQQFFPDKRGRR
ncbi:solute carrier family 35 member F2-like [Selaginella moellendorffii]|uniref:solute carrier family 35 member F2-like n=1 Tax=Selaginella moellendorffii TaxID=88036 RepID=UPI000D1D085D|nr:solute carrier family 35 member F2-like [Selaginella moellendorffii]|eukprot:XP_024527848.1 solute carrier family 35 member F2-like [Selaginella moellendorffii]